MQQKFQAEIGQPFTFVAALYGGTTPRHTTTKYDVAAYAQRLGITQLPVLADGVGAFKKVSPITQRRHPEMCAITPDMRILKCGAGHGAVNGLFDAIRTDIAQNSAKPDAGAPNKATP